MTVILSMGHAIEQLIKPYGWMAGCSDKTIPTFGGSLNIAFGKCQIKKEKYRMTLLSLITITDMHLACWPVFLFIYDVIYDIID